MKRLLICDSHLGLYSDSDLWLDIVLNFYKHIVKYCIKNNIKEIVHLGDFFHNRKVLNTKSQHTAHRIAKVLEISKELHTYIIVGNHDCYYKNQIHPNTLELFKKYNHITIIDEITKLDDILLVPWGMVPEDTQEAKYCFGHFAINGFHMNDSYKCKTGIDRIKFKDFDMVMSGHFHCPSSNDNIKYLGAPYGQNFNDADGVRGYHLFEDGKLNFIEYNDAPKFKKIFPESYSEEDITGNIIKLVFTKDYGTNKNQEIIDNIIKYKPLLYSIDFANIKTDDSEEQIGEDISIDNKDQIVNQYIDKQEYPTNINVSTLKAMFKKMMKEVGENSIVNKTTDGTKIEFVSMGFKNFLSFGSKQQIVDLKNGVNFVTGLDKDKNKSNGAGKSSLLEVIPFTLFGKTARNINQTQIVNWKNKKNLETFINFKIGNDVYKVLRGMKPNKFEIYKNDNLIDQDAHKTDYQNMFENIFGMNFKMFMSLIYSNINTLSNILGMKKNEKRDFLERMFDLSVYSEMNKLCNDKLRNIEQKKYKIETDVNSANDKIESSERLKVQFNTEINSKKNSMKNVDEIKKELDDVKKNNKNIVEEIKSINDKIKREKELFSNVRIDYEKCLVESKNKKQQIEKEIRNIDRLEELKKENERIQTKIDKIIEKTGDIDQINSSIENKEKDSSKQNKLLNKDNEESLKIYKEIADLRADLKSSEESLKLLSDGKCPTCGQDTKDPVSHHKKDISSIKRKITTREKKYKEYSENIKKYKKEIDEISNKIKVLHKTKDTLNNLRSKIKDAEYDKNKDELVKERKSIEELENREVKNFSDKQKKHKNSIETSENKLKELNVIQEKINGMERDYEIAISQNEEIKKSIKSLKSMIKEQEENIKNVKNGIKDSDDNVKKLNNIVDYINTIKVILKDENIKQYTIKRIMPFINKQANYYLSEVNYGFYLKITGWLDVEIKGPGIRNATYDSLSSGEKKGVDLAIQLALLDISQNMIGLFPDILIFDELLDSSIDGVGMNKLMTIIKNKQKEFNSKIFVISHRQEIDPEMISNEYKIIKENGFSKVEI